MYQYILISIAVVITGYLLNRLYFSGDKCKSKNRLDGKVVIITGANTGIGKETALDLARRGACVILACRNKELGQKAADDIMMQTSNKNVEVEILDLADLSSVRDFATRMNDKLNKLDILINNAGIMMCPYWKTKDNFEMQFGTNHLGHFLLTNLLLDLIKKSPQSRIINVSSLNHKIGKINWDDINSEKSYNSILAYAQSKLANILFTIELAKRLKNNKVTVVSLHPGSVITDLQRNLGIGVNFLIPYLIFLIYPIWCMFNKNAYEGAQTSIHCAVDDSIPELSGRYFSDCKPVEPAKNAQDYKDAERLWELSANLVRL